MTLSHESAPGTRAACMPDASSRRQRVVRGLALGPILLVLVAGCSTNQPVRTAPSLAQTPSLQTQPPVVVPKPVVGNTVALASCCTATLPLRWTTPRIVDSNLLGSYDPTGRLYVSWQVLGGARSCPNQPPAVVESLFSPSHPSGNVIIGVDPFTIQRQHVTLYITAPNAATPRAYEFVNADAVLGANCVDLGGAEYGVASTPNLETLLGILATTKPIVASVQPARTP